MTADGGMGNTAMGAMRRAHYRARRHAGYQDCISGMLGTKRQKGPLGGAGAGC